MLTFYGASPAKKSKGTYKTKCILPGHDDRTPSAAVYLDKQYFRCFTCDWSGDAWALIMHMENLDFKAALEFAKTFLGADTVTRDDGGGKAPKKKLSLAERRKALE